MARALRMEFEGAVYHVMSRGDRKEAIFRDDTDRRRFLETLGEVCRRTDWEVHAVCLMGNHFHLVLETPKPNLVAGMKWFLGTFTGRFNRRHRTTGHLFGGRYKALVVDGESPGYFLTVCEYVHLNPARAGLVKPEEPLKAYPWSSFAEYLKPPTARWPWLRVDRLYGEMRLDPSRSSGRRRFEEQTESRRLERPEAWKEIRRGWYFGGAELKERLLERELPRFRPDHLGAARSEGDEAKAERILREELAKLHWTDAELGKRRKGDPGKVLMARRLRLETTRTLAWIARRLEMGSWTHVSNLLRAPTSAESRPVSRPDQSVKSED